MDLIKEYSLGGAKPQILQGGLMSFKVTAKKMLLDTTYASLVYAQSPIDFIIGPAGTATGKTKITLKSVILKTWNYKNDQKGVVLEDVAGEGTDITFGTF